MALLPHKSVQNWTDLSDHTCHHYSVIQQSYWADHSLWQQVERQKDVDCQQYKVLKSIIVQEIGDSAGREQERDVFEGVAKLSDSSEYLNLILDTPGSLVYL